MCVANSSPHQIENEQHSTTTTKMSSSTDDIVIAAVEAGGTSFVVAICHVLPKSSIPKIVHRLEVDSSHANPHKTLEECAAFLKMHKPSDGYHALAIGSFGPVGTDETKPKTYGHILPTCPKVHWRNVDLLTPMREACQGTRPLPVKVDTDVNAPAMAEYLHSPTDKKKKSSVAYVTVGTGVGVGLVVNDKPVHGMMHPEAGHVPVQPLPGDTFGGYSWGEEASPYHGKNTVEGLASAVALTERYEKRSGETNVSRIVLSTLSDDDEIWDHCANALANLCTTLLLTLSMEKIVFGGGLMNRNGLLEKIRARTNVLLNGYLDISSNDLDHLITKSQFGSDAGLVGTIILAQSAYEEYLEHKATTDQSHHNTSMSNGQHAAKPAILDSAFWQGTAIGIFGMALVSNYMV